MTSEHYLREIAELLREMNQRLARIEAALGAFPKLTFLRETAGTEGRKWHENTR
jgi:predicted secreted protein